MGDKMSLKWDHEKILYEKDSHVAIITKNRPDKLNAMDQEMMDAYYEAIEDAENDDDVRVIVITGIGKGWHPGADPEMFRKGTASMKKGNLPKIFVINLRRDKDKWEKYNDDSRYIRFSACNGVEVSKANPYYKRLEIMWNAGDKKKKCTAGILNSHMSIIKKIVKNKINQALVIEDDAIVDFAKLKKFPRRLKV